MINVNACNVKSGAGRPLGKRGGLSAPHGPMTSYTTIVGDNSVIELEQKCKKFGIYKMLEGIVTMILCIFFFAVLESLRKDVANFSKNQDKFWTLSKWEQRLYMSCLLSYSLLCFLSGLTSLVGVVKKNNMYMRLCFCIQVTSVLFSTILLIPTLYFVGPVFKGLLSFFALVYFPYNIYLTYIIKHYLDQSNLESIRSAAPGKYECPSI